MRVLKTQEWQSHQRTEGRVGPRRQRGQGGRPGGRVPPEPLPAPHCSFPAEDSVNSVSSGATSAERVFCFMGNRVFHLFHFYISSLGSHSNKSKDIHNNPSEPHWVEILIFRETTLPRLFSLDLSYHIISVKQVQSPTLDMKGCLLRDDLCKENSRSICISSALLQSK